MKILVITGSHRPGSNSTILADNFIKGAEEAGHEVFKFEAAKMQVNPCTGCDHCHMDGPCIFKDDFEIVREHIIPADVVVFATPMYYFGISAQIKAVIDRFYAINPKITGGKKGVLLLTFGGDDLKTAHGIHAQYEIMLNFLKWQDAGQIAVPGVNLEKDVLKTDFPKAAYDLGNSI